MPYVNVDVLPCDFGGTMTWLDLLDLLEDAPLRLLREEIVIYQHEDDGTHRDFSVDEVCCPGWDETYWDPRDGMVLQIRLREHKSFDDEGHDE